ncbi:sulfate adenylyltransferase subunit 1 [Thermonema lapsum]|uniref:sulfate adenylyltransferase n=1 Tax=Thermonema lapsum TaxID=28195 RepID=A0A846MS72_9BACT|nr:GTP-binding protein [Thermonema lapsum]NIK74107.1 sulfate adenylyltransferase subunit 1 [Thermonema lapsum]
MDILRFLTAGNVDDGKSTLIGRMLYDSHALLEDQIQAIARASKSKGLPEDEIDLSLITDGLRDERQQGITIDVAYKYFHTDKRKFIIADTPGHVQYTRNMVTGASNCQLAIILVDARNGVTEQTRRHSYVSALLGIPHFVICVNKMDLVDYSQQRFEEIVADYRAMAQSMSVQEVTFIPISALKGDNVVHRSSRMPWYMGKPLLQHLEEVPVTDDLNYELTRFQVQYIIRPKDDRFHDYRGYAGRMMSGTLKVGDAVMVYPAGMMTTVTGIELGGQPLEETQAPMSATLLLADDIDISRGDYIFKPEQMPAIVNEVEADICWLDQKPLMQGGKYWLQHHSKKVQCRVESIIYKTDIHSLQAVENQPFLAMNDIGRVRLRLAEELCIDDYRTNRATGSAILIDSATFNTVAAVMMRVKS